MAAAPCSVADCTAPSRSKGRCNRHYTRWIRNGSDDLLPRRTKEDPRPLSTSPEDLAWLAGLLEGEGSFFLRKAYPCITVGMTDQDVIERVAGLLGKSVQSLGVRAEGRKPAWRAQVQGSAAAAWMRVLYPQMGARRKAKIDEVLAAYESRVLPSQV